MPGTTSVMHEVGERHFVVVKFRSPIAYKSYFNSAKYVRCG